MSILFSAQSGHSHAEQNDIKTSWISYSGFICAEIIGHLRLLMLHLRLMRRDTSSLTEIQALATIPRHAIHLHWPSSKPYVTESNPGTVFEPDMIHDPSLPQLHILYTRCEPAFETDRQDESIWRPNHFVPLIDVQHEADGAEFESAERRIQLLLSSERRLRCPDRPDGSVKFVISAEGSTDDGWRWHRTAGGERRYFLAGGERCHLVAGQFCTKVRRGRQFLNELVPAEQRIYEITPSQFVHVTASNYHKRVSEVRQVQPLGSESAAHAFVVEYLWRGEKQVLSQLAHGNATTNVQQPFEPTDREVLTRVRAEIEVGNADCSDLYDKYKPQLRNKRQIYNLKADVQRHAHGEARTQDPWNGILSIHQAGGDLGEFIKSIAINDRQLSVFCSTPEGLSNLETNVGFGNPSHFDTTFGSCAYLTYVAFRNIKLIDRDSGRSPLFIAAGVIHSKEKDSHAIALLLTQIRDRCKFQPYVITDECAVLEKRLHETFPAVRHALGREHLISNFLNRAHAMKVPQHLIPRLKAAFFGPPALVDEEPVMSSSSAIRSVAEGKMPAFCFHCAVAANGCFLTFLGNLKLALGSKIEFNAMCCLMALMSWLLCHSAQHS
jgi:hypothetical protein